MPIDTAFYLVTKDIALRSGLVGQRYIAPDGRYILDNKDLSRIRFTTEEYITGLQGVERITSADAQRLIAEGRYNMTEQPTTVEEEEETNEETDETNNEEEEEQA